MKNQTREYGEIYGIYGINEWKTLAILLLNAALLSLLSLLLHLYFTPICSLIAAILAVCLYVVAATLFHSAGQLRWEMSQRMIGAVADWSNVRTALDVGCGRGILLNAVARRLKEEGRSGRVVGLDVSRSVTMATLHTASVEGVQEYVTCREADVRQLPYNDNYFDVVVSAVFLHTVGKEFGRNSAAAMAERVRAVAELVRVLKPGGVGVVWDLQHVPEYVRKLQELRMEDVWVSERVTAFFVSSHVVSFRKPCQQVVGPAHVTLDLSGHHHLLQQE